MISFYDCYSNTSTIDHSDRVSERVHKLLDMLGSQKIRHKSTRTSGNMPADSRHQLEVEEKLQELLSNGVNITYIDLTETASDNVDDLDENFSDREKLI
uniref:Uncharacterized protein n=1 Tax=Romanomermis culicivorax TaxID=13658 RepID=A0A915JJN0_ROMCU